MAHHPGLAGCSFLLGSPKIPPNGVGVPEEKLAGLKEDEVPKENPPPPEEAELKEGEVPKENAPPNEVEDDELEGGDPKENVLPNEEELFPEVIPPNPPEDLGASLPEDPNVNVEPAFFLMSPQEWSKFRV